MYVQKILKWKILNNKCFLKIYLKQIFATFHNKHAYESI
jgi:hypothetical protein